MSRRARAVFAEVVLWVALFGAIVFLTAVVLLIAGVGTGA